VLTIYRSSNSLSLNRVPIWLVGSDGTSPATGEAAGQPQICWHARGTATVNTSGTLSAVSANAGLYHVELTASEISCLGVFSVHYRSANAIAQTVFGKIVNYDSGDSVRFGQFALPNAAAEAAGGLITNGTGAGQLAVSSGSVGLQAITHSGATIKGIENYANISNVTLAAGTHSNVTIQGVTLLNSGVTINNATYSSVTVRMQGVLYSGLTIDGVNIVSTAGERSIASSWMSTNLGNARLAQEALFVLRNRVAVSGSTMTVYLTDDATSSWTASVTTGTATITNLDPGGA
jgi:hypothetical protein